MVPKAGLVEAQVDTIKSHDLNSKISHADLNDVTISRLWLIMYIQRSFYPNFENLNSVPRINIYFYQQLSN